MTAACELCGTRFQVTHPAKRFCSERCRRIVANRRYRVLRIETATCPRCGSTFERTATTKRLQRFCSPACQYEQRSIDYQARPDIQAGLSRARQKARGQPAESIVTFS